MSRDIIIKLDPDSLGTVQQCDSALLMLDEAIAKISAQLEFDKCGTENDWQYRASLALKLTTAKREAVLRRRESLINHLPAFMGALETAYGVETIRHIWNSVN